MLSLVHDPRLLIARVAQGDAAAFELLVGLLHPPMLRLAMRIATDPGEGEDALQSAYARLWTHAARFDGERGSVEGWFRRILVNQCIDRRRAFRVVAPLEAAYDLATTEPDPFEASAAQAVSVRVDVAMLQLSARQRAAVALFYGEGATMAEIAITLQTSAKAVEGLLARARIELQTLLAREQDR